MSLLSDQRSFVVATPKLVFDRVRRLAIERRTTISSEVVRLVIQSLGRIDGDRAADATVATLTDAARECRKRR